MFETGFVYLKHYLIVLTALSCFYFIGYLLLKVAAKSYLRVQGFYQNLFVRVLTGLTVSVVVYSLVVSSLYTVNLLFILISVFYFIEFRIRKKNKNEIVLLKSEYDGSTGINLHQLKSKLIPLLFISLSIFTWFSTIILSGNNFIYSIPEIDNISYANLSVMLGETGIENAYANTISDSKKIHPYHYFDLWLNAGASKLFNSSHLLFLYLFTYPLLNILTAIGFCVFFERSGHVKFSKICLSLLFLFTGGLYFNIHNPSPEYILCYTETSVEHFGEKLSAYIPFMILSILFFANKFFSLGLISLLTLPVISITTSFAILGGILLFLLIGFFTKWINRHTFSWILVYVFLFAALLISLYYKAPNPLNNDTDSILNYTDLSGYDLTSFKIFFAELFYRVKNTSHRTFQLYFLLIISVLIGFYKSKNIVSKQLIAIGLCCYISSLIAYGSIYKMWNAWQLYTNSLTIINVIIVFLISSHLAIDREENYTLKIIKRTTLLLIASILFSKGVYAFNIYKQYKIKNNIFSDEYLQTIKNLKFGKEKKSGFALYNNLDYKSLVEKKLINNHGYLSFMSQYNHCFDLSIFHYDSLSEKENLGLIPFLQFVNEQKQNNQFASIEKSKTDFIEKYQLKFAVVSPGIKISDYILAKSDTILIDKKSGQRFIVLK